MFNTLLWENIKSCKAGEPCVVFVSNFILFLFFKYVFQLVGFPFYKIKCVML